MTKDQGLRTSKNPSRSLAIQTALVARAARHKRRRLVEELGKLDRRQEQALANEVSRERSSGPKTGS
jgi:hypothetical protein